VFSTIYIILVGFQKINAEAWITLYWIVILFASVNAGAKSFIAEGRSRLLYYYGISSPQNIILSKLLYNCILISVISIIAFIGFIFFFGNAVDKPWNFVVIMLLGSTGLAGVFTMVSAIASKARGSATLMTILSFPVIIPQLLLLIKLSRRAASLSISNVNMDIGYRELGGLLCINLIVIIVSIMLFPYLWRD
jgi:heme exporter protein B